MTKDDLIRELHQKLGNKHTMKDLNVIVDEMLNLMSEKLQKGEEIL